MSKVEELKVALAASRVAAEGAYGQQLRTNKFPAMMAHQRGEISAEEYEEVVGEPYAETVRANYEADIARLKENTAARVQLGLLTPEQYREITGDEYAEEATEEVEK